MVIIPSKIFYGRCSKFKKILYFYIKNLNAVLGDAVDQIFIILKSIRESKRNWGQEYPDL
jgi:hypothetical protein